MHFAPINSRLFFKNACVVSSYFVLALLLPYASSVASLFSLSQFITLEPVSYFEHHTSI